MGLSIVCEVLTILATTVAIGILSYFRWCYTYWKRKNLPHLEPRFPFGTMENPLARTTSLGFWIKKNYDELKSQGHKHGGLYNFAQPAYLPIDPEYVKNIMQRDFHHFVDRGFYYNERDEPLSAHLFAVGGHKWRNLRTKLTPGFTSGKMKLIFDTLLQCSVSLKEAMNELIKNRQEIDIKETVARFATDVIGSCAFGLVCNSFKDPDAEFRKYGKKIFERTRLSALANMMVFLSRPEIGRFFRVRFYPKETMDFFMKVVKDTLEYRKANNIIRKDMLQVLIDLKNKEQLTVEELAAQAFAFFAAGFETSSSTITFCLFELASNQKIQQKVRQEVNQVLARHCNKITYESLIEMNRMTRVIEETLRMYPPAPYISRRCVKDYKVPNTDVTIEKGTNVFVSTAGLHYDPEFHPEPEIFNPERFSKECKERMKPFTYIPFGEGPRICIGQRFGMMEVKVALTVLLKSFEFSLSRKTKVPVEVNCYKNLFSTKGTIWLDAKIVK